MLALRLFTSRSCVKFSRTLPQSFCRLTHEDSKTKESTKLHVYDGIIRSRLRGTKMLCLSTSAAFLFVSPTLYWKLAANNSGTFAWSAMSFFLLAGISTPVILHLFAKKYVIAMRFDRDSKTFEADTFNFFGRTKTITFTPDDVAFPDLAGLANVAIKKKPYLIDHESITDADAYEIFMKYDKPLDLGQGPDSGGKENVKDIAKQ